MFHIIINIISIVYLFLLLRITRIYVCTKEEYFDKWGEWKLHNKKGKIYIKIWILLLFLVCFILGFLSTYVAVIIFLLIFIYNLLYFTSFEEKKITIKGTIFEEKNLSIKGTIYVKYRLGTKYNFRKNIKKILNYSIHF